jgi:hypothetical protein
MFCVQNAASCARTSQVISQQYGSGTTYVFEYTEHLLNKRELNNHGAEPFFSILLF